MSTEVVADAAEVWPVEASDLLFSGMVVDVRRDTLAGADGDSFERDIVVTAGAVAVLAVDPDDRVLIVEQYRHPAGQRLVELPAGLLDKPGEEPLTAARRELVEEGHVDAEHWQQLLRLMPSPGISDETITVYLAESLHAVEPPPDFTAAHEEAAMTRRWVPLADLVAAVLAGRVANATSVAAVLALWATRHSPPA